MVEVNYLRHHFKDIKDDILDEMADFIINEFKKSRRKKLLFVGIGTDKLIGDSVGCLTGTKLIERNVNLTIIGTLDNPVHALNLNKTISELKKTYPDYFVIACDSAIAGCKDYFEGYVTVKNKPIKPGYGVGKELTNIGDVSISGIVTKETENFMSLPIRLSLVNNISNAIVRILEQTEKKVRLEMEFA